jgi:hypothetical protein
MPGSERLTDDAVRASRYRPAQVEFRAQPRHIGGEALYGAILFGSVTCPVPAKVHGNHAVTRAQRFDSRCKQGMVASPSMYQDNRFTRGDVVVCKANPVMLLKFHFRFLEHV